MDRPASAMRRPRLGKAIYGATKFVVMGPREVEFALEKFPFAVPMNQAKPSRACCYSEKNGETNSEYFLSRSLEDFPIGSGISEINTAMSRRHRLQLVADAFNA